MKTIIIKTQEELDGLPDSFSELTVLEIRCESRIVISKNMENSRAVLRDNSSAVLRDNSSAVLCDDSRAVLCDNSRAVLRDNSSAVLCDDSRAELRENSRAVLLGNSSAVLCDDSRAELRDNSSAVLRDNSSAVLCDNSSAELCDNSSAELWGNSSADLFLCSTVFIFSIGATIRSLRDNSRSVYKVAGCKDPLKKDKTALITPYEELITPTLEQWLDRGYVVADGIHQRLVSQKTIGEVTIFEVTDFFEKEKSFVAKTGNKFAHGKTIEDATKDLRYKISDRDKSKFESWKITDEKPIDEIIEAYITITGACSFGTKAFCESIKLKDRYLISEIFDLTSGQFGNNEFKEFFKS